MVFYVINPFPQTTISSLHDYKNFSEWNCQTPEGFFLPWTNLYEKSFIGLLASPSNAFPGLIFTTEELKKDIVLALMISNSDYGRHLRSSFEWISPASSLSSMKRLHTKMSTFVKKISEWHFSGNFSGVAESNNADREEDTDGARGERIRWNI